MEGLFWWMRKKDPWSSNILYQTSKGCIFVLAMHDFFICTYHRHLPRIRNYVRLVLFLSQKGFFEGKEQIPGMFLPLQHSHVFLGENEDLHFQGHPVSFGAIWYMPAPPKPFLPFHICFLAWWCNYMTKLFKLNPCVFHPFCWQDILAAFLLLAAFVVENWWIIHFGFAPALKKEPSRAEIFNRLFHF